MHGSRITTAVAVATFGAAVSGPAFAVVRTWDGSSSTSWNTAANWTPSGLPQQFVDEVVIGNAPNNAVVLNGPGPALSGSVRLVGGSGATLNTNGNQLLAFQTDNTGFVEINNGNLLLLSPTASPIAPALITDTLRINNGGSVLHGGLTTLNLADINTGGNLNGAGEMRLSVPTGGDPFTTVVLSNDGTISPGFLGAGSLVIKATNGTIDLDGTSGNGVVRATASGFLSGPGNALLRFEGNISDAFDGTMEIAAADRIEFTQGWTHDGTLTMQGTAADPATLQAPFVNISAGGTVNVTQGKAIFDTDLTFNTGGFTAAANTETEFRGETRFENGSSFSAGGLATNQPATIRVVGNGTPESDGGGRLLFLGPNDVDLDGQSGANTIRLDNAAALWVDGRLDTGSGSFDGSLITSHNSSIRLNGRAIFGSGSTFNKAFSDNRLLIYGHTTINTNIDLDGVGTTSRIDIGRDVGVTNDARLDIRGLIESPGSAQTFNGTINNGGTLDVDLPAAVAWTLGSGGHLRMLSTSGGAEVFGDTVNVTSGGIISGAGTFFANVLLNSASALEVGRGQLTSTIETGDGTGLMTWSGAGLTINGGSTVELQIAGTNRGASASGFDAIDATGISINGGRLDLVTLPSLSLTLYQELILMQQTGGGAITGGVFDTVGGVVVGGGPVIPTALAVTYEGAQVIVQRALLGDANLNGAIEQGDLDAVLNNWGSSNLANPAANISWATGDYTGDGVVNQADLDAVLNFWGSSLDGSLSGIAAPDFRGLAVPEPAAALLLLALVASPRTARTREVRL